MAYLNEAGRGAWKYPLADVVRELTAASPELLALIALAVRTEDWQPEDSELLRRGDILQSRLRLLAALRALNVQGAHP